MVLQSKVSGFWQLGLDKRSFVLTCHEWRSGAELVWTKMPDGHGGIWNQRGIERNPTEVYLLMMNLKSWIVHGMEKIVTS